MATLTGVATCGLAFSYLGSNDLMSLASTLAESWGLTFTSGTGTNQVNALFADTRSLVATSENLDLYGSLVDSYGTTLNLTKVKLLAIRNKSTTPLEVLTLSGNWFSAVVLGGTTPTYKVHPGGGPSYQTCSPIDGYTVTATTADILTVSSGAFDITYDVIILGCV